MARSMMDTLQIAGCWREITKLSDKNLLLEDILNFYFVVRMQLPLRRLVPQTAKLILDIKRLHISIKMSGFCNVKN